MRTLAASPIEPPAQPDPGLPGLETALVAEELGARLADCWTEAHGAPPEPGLGRLFYVRYKPGTSLLVGFHFRRRGAEQGPPDGGALSLDVDGTPDADLLGYARLLPAARFEQAVAAARRVAARRRGARVLVQGGGRLLFHLFPFDRTLPGLRTAARRGPLKRWTLAQLAWPESGGRVRGKASLVSLERYKPERRAVFAVDLLWENRGATRQERRAVLIKSYAPGEGTRTWSLMQRLAAVPLEGVTLAAPLAWRAAERLLVQSRVPGLPLFECAEPVARGEAVGAALRRLQCAIPATAPDLDPTRAASPPRALEELSRLAWHFERLGAPDLAAQAERLHSRLRTGRPAAVPPTLVHGDFYHHQVLCDAGRIAIVDFDEAGLGDPRADAGNFLAHLELTRLREAGNAETQARAAALGTAFLRGYSAAGGPTTDLDWFTALGLARLALVPFRNLRPGWRASAHDLLARAIEVRS